MAAYTSTQSGDWDDVATWGGGGFPVNNDTATISVNHTVTVPTGVTATVGTSGVSGTVAVTINQSASTSWGILVIQDGGILILRGDVTNNGRIQVEGGSIIEFDSSLAASPSTTKYKITLSNSGGAGVARFITASTSSLSRATVRSNASGGNGYINSANFRGYVECQYIDFLRVGDATNDSISIPGNGSSANKFSLQDATFDACGRYGPGSIVVDLEARMANIISTNSLGASIMNTSCSLALGSSARIINNISCDKAMIGTVALQGFTISYVVIPANFLISISSNTPPASIAKAWVRGLSGGAALNVACDVSDSYIWNQATSGTITNPHPINCSAMLSAMTVDGMIIEGGDTITSADGDLFNPGGPAAPQTITVRHCIALPNSGTGLHVGQFISALGNANITVVQEHNTYVTSSNTGESGGPSYGETYAGHASMWTSVKSNLAVGLSSGTGVIFSRRGLGTVSDGVLAANCTHNGVYNAANAVVGVDGYCDYGTAITNPMFSSTTGLGDDDVRADPQFVDMARNLATWAVSQGSAAVTYATQCDDAQSYLQANPLLVDDLLDHVRGGWAPTNPAFRDAGHDGATIGAVEGVFGTGSRPVRRFRRFARGV